MNNYIFFYFIATALSLYWGIGVLRKYKNLWWLFFFFYTVLASLWLIFYFIFFSDYPFPEEYRLIFSRIDYGLSPITLICFVLFIYFFGKRQSWYWLLEQIWENKVLMIFLSIIFITIFYTSIFTDNIIERIELDKHGIYREVFWSLTWLSTAVYISFIPISFIFFIKKQKELSYIDKVRISKIIWVKLIFLSLLITLQVILPLYGIWILENEIIVLFVISVLVIANIIQRYYFSPTWYEFSRLLLTIIALIIISFIIWWFIGQYAIPYELLTDNFSSFIFILAYSSLVLGIFHVLSFLFDKYILAKTQLHIIEWKMKTIKRNMVQFLDIKSLNSYLQTEVSKVFQTKEIEVVKITKKEQVEFLSKAFVNMKKKIVMDDFVFLEENMIRFNFKKIKTGLSDPFLCIPIYYNTNEVRWLLMLWRKKFWAFYSVSEIAFLEDIVHILSIHMQYIDVYNQLEDISRNLDRKVDEKTIEYNTLISRQKEFIATLSHEIKAPLTSALLQIDNLSADMEEGRLSDIWIREEVISIGDNLAHTKTLLSQLFTTEYLEKSQATLYPERVNIIELILSQYHLQKKVHQHIIYTESTPKWVIYMGIDKTQFIQVLTNLFTNAAKFADPKSPEIYLDIKENENSIIIGIEDNGQWLNGIELEEIFEKYTIGKNSIGLGIGLYLCKRIVELHDGTISAQKWKKLSWIRIEISIPIE